MKPSLWDRVGVVLSSSRIGAAMAGVEVIDDQSRLGVIKIFITHGAPIKPGARRHGKTAVAPGKNFPRASGITGGGIEIERGGGGGAGVGPVCQSFADMVVGEDQQMIRPGGQDRRRSVNGARSAVLAERKGAAGVAAQIEPRGRTGV